MKMKMFNLSEMNHPTTKIEWNQQADKYPHQEEPASEAQGKKGKNQIQHS
jgi:hypothetical protein